MIKESEQLKKSTVVKKCYNEHDCTHVNYGQYIFQLNAFSMLKDAIKI